jgi:hypothetical protein
VWQEYESCGCMHTLLTLAVVRFLNDCWASLQIMAPVAVRLTSGSPVETSLLAPETAELARTLERLGLLL